MGGSQVEQYNVYKIKKDKEHDLIEKLEKVGLQKTYQDIIEGMDCSFYFSTNPGSKPVPWISLYKEFLGSFANEGVSNRSYFGAFVISSNDFCYVISLGKTHFYLKNFCYPDFGIELGTRIIDEHSIDLKNSRLFGGNRRKNIIAYQNDSPIEFDSGEAIVYLKGKTISEVWGRKVSCGNSVQFTFKGVKTRDFPSFILKIEQKLQDKKLYDIPSSHEVREKEVISRLDTKLVDSIRNNHSMLSIEQQYVSGVEFVFLKDYDLELKTDSGWVNIDPDITIEQFNLLLEQEGIELIPENLNKIKIRASAAGIPQFTNNIRHFIDFVDEEYHFLQDGKWYKFNQPYIEFLEDAVNSIEFQVRPEHNFDSKGFETFMQGLPNEERSKWYKEKYFNEIQMKKYGFNKFDREIGLFDKYKLEFTDLYKDDTLFFVKIGIPQKLGYVMDQSLAVVNYLQQNKGIIQIGENLLRPKKICLWLILDRKIEIKRITDLKSFIFLMKLNEWRRRVENARYVPQVIVSYVK